MQSKIIVVVGPTGVGKTKLSLELAKKYDAEIINADSMQIYQGLNIGTAKITDAEKEHIPHHMLDIKDVNEMYTVYDYQKDAREILNSLLEKKKNVIIVGGTGLYIKALLYNYEFSKENHEVLYEELSNEELFMMVQKINPETNIHINNRKRLIRYLNREDKEVKKSDKLLYDNVYFVGLTTDRETLYSKINNRVDQMITDGLLIEVEELYKNNIHSKAISTGIGYKELYEYYNGNTSLEDTIDLIKRNSRRYAKRQYTWFNHQLPVIWFNVDYIDFNNTIKNVVNYIDDVIIK